MKMTIAIIFLVIYFVIALIATKAIIKYRPSRKQRAFQILLSWLLPFIGGFICILFNRKGKEIGSHIDKAPSWTRLVKYDEHGEA